MILKFETDSTDLNHLWLRLWDMPSAMKSSDTISRRRNILDLAQSISNVVVLLSAGPTWMQVQAVENIPFSTYIITRGRSTHEANSANLKGKYRNYWGIHMLDVVEP